MWVAETAARALPPAGRAGEPVQICINISGCNLRDANFPDHMAALRERMSVPWGGIGMEITESVAMHDLDATASVLARLQLKGFAVAMDDFGTGHSSLIALRRMPFSTIKIDKSFVQRPADLQRFAQHRPLSDPARPRHAACRASPRALRAPKSPRRLDRTRDRRAAGLLLQQAAAVRGLRELAAGPRASTPEPLPAAEASGRPGAGPTPAGSTPSAGSPRASSPASSPPASPRSRGSTASCARSG